MEKKITEIDGTKREIEIILSEEDVRPHFQKAYKTAQPQIDLKGFRKGRVPINMIKKYFGKKIELEALQDISTEMFAEYIKSEDIKMIGTPKLLKLDSVDNQYFVNIEYEVMPEFELANYKDIEIDEPVHPVSDDEVSKEIEFACRNNGSLEDADKITDDLFVATIKLQVVDDSTHVPIIGEKTLESQIYLADKNILPEMKSNLLDKEINDSFIFRPSQHDNSFEYRTLRITVNKIQKLVPKEFNNEFVEQYTNGKFQTTEEYRDEIGFRLQENWDYKSRQEMENQIISKIVDLHDFDVPESVANDVSLAMVRDLREKNKDNPEAANLNPKMMVDSLLPLAERTVRWEMIRGLIIKKEGLEIENFDVENIINEEVERTQGNRKAISNKIKQNQQVMDTLLTKKVLDFLLDFAVTNEISFEDYYEKMKKNAPNTLEEFDDEPYDIDDNENEKPSNIITL